FENCVDGMVDMVEKNYLVVAKRMAQAAPGKHINTYMLHWLAHMIIDAFIHLITHEQNEKKALVIISRIMDFLVGSWMELVLED
ncbi:MAG: TetR/AcrR family transcriptional regulator, partial [Lachnospiraceae bacterium]|nr:TetR/AcrR family transcriptional regulator [Lachnospiraceae bacterium]